MWAGFAFILRTSAIQAMLDCARFGVGSDCGHYTGSFNEEYFERLLSVLSTVKGKFMLTMFPHPSIKEYADKHGWRIHKLERTISASKTNRRKQEEWITTNY